MCVCDGCSMYFELNLKKIFNRNTVTFSGAFYADCVKEEWNEASKNMAVAEELWTESCRLTGIDN